ncbi:nuclear transport factor 2 family protein [Aestuariicella hydrocarbonica]|uniref:Nuclear transport factor 2 family protein n=1 Tax=Pseudomaricurvus hydrocarbonicus TaxID=1470433 RepID=A0A9E5MKP3_9GAMM|nr:nuclear transport factor 2 family protein [Aestuariicella hydrocarbonica]NHO66834.1 nuclear transport factor 2 family protein [Aestuariicella hydrocarbonica]
MAFYGPLEDRILIQELVATYGDAVSRRNKIDFANTWDMEGIWHLPWLDPVIGRDAIADVWELQIANYPFHNFSGYLGSLEINGSHAKGRLWTSELVESTAGRSGVVTGLYHDEFVKRGDHWLFARKTFTPLHGMDAIVKEDEA